MVIIYSMMRIFGLLGLLYMSGVACLEYKALIIGDSLSQWGTWARRLHSEDGIRVTNTGVAGATSSHVVDFIVEGKVQILDNNLFTILLGTNDCGGNVSPAIFKENILFIMDTIQQTNPGPRMSAHHNLRHDQYRQWLDNQHR